MFSWLHQYSLAGFRFFFRGKITMTCDIPMTPWLIRCPLPPLPITAPIALAFNSNSSSACRSSGFKKKPTSILIRWIPVSAQCASVLHWGYPNVPIKTINSCKFYQSLTSPRLGCSSWGPCVWNKHNNYVWKSSQVNEEHNIVMRCVQLVQCDATKKGPL